MPSRVRELLKDFYGYCTLHGLHFLFDSSWNIRRVIWFFLLLIATCTFGFHAIEAYAKWRKHEVYITTKFDNEKELKFPSVTICNKNMLKKSKIMGKDGQRYLDGQNHNLVKDWPTIYREMNDSFDIEKEVLENGHRAKDVIKEMKFDAVCPGPLNEVKTTSFLDSRSGLCHTIHVKNNVRKLGESYGLSLLLDAEPHEYYGPYSWDGTGFKLMVHAADTYPVIDFHGIDIPTGFKTNLKIRKKKKIHLPEPYPTKCGSKKLKSSNVYSETWCLMEEYAHEAGRKCGCRLVGVPVVNEKNRRYCKVSEIVNCTFPALYSYSFDASECPTKCNSESYEVQSSSLVYPSQSVWDKKYNSNRNVTFACGAEFNVKKEYHISKMDNESFKNWFRGRYARVTVFFSSKDVEIIQEMPAFDNLDFAGNLGGNMGLYLGCSVLTLAEFVDLLVLVIVQWLTKKGKTMKVSDDKVEKQQQKTCQAESM